MDAELIFKELANFGFPMTLAWYLLVRLEGKIDALAKAVNEAKAQTKI